MDFNLFKKSLDQSSPPVILSPALQAMWYDGKGDWEKVHEIAQEIDEESDGAWVPAYLHRKEGDHFNADYWFKRAVKEILSISLEQEWMGISKSLIR